MVAEIPGWGDSGANHAGVAFPDGGEMTETLTQGNTLIEQNGYNWIDGNSGLNPKRLPYKLVTTTARDAASSPYSVKTLTTWDFTSDAKTTRLPLIQLDYSVDTDIANLASRSAAITITPSHLPGAVSTKKITSTTLDVSYDDGVTWVSQRMHKTAKGWTTDLRAPKTAQNVTLRAAAEDAYGNSVEQTITRAFGLK
jgi:hypothetical protein